MLAGRLAPTWILLQTSPTRGLVGWLALIDRSPAFVVPWCAMNANEIVAPTGEPDSGRTSRPWARVWWTVMHLTQIAVLGVGIAAVGAVVWASVRWSPAPGWRPRPVMDAGLAYVLLSGVAPLVLGGGLLGLIWFGHPLARDLLRRWRLAWRDREVARSPRPVGVREPEEFVGVAIIKAAQRAAHRETLPLQGAMYRRGIFVAALPALAVLLAALPELRVGNTPWAVGSAVAQIVALTAAILLVRRHRSPAKAWVAARTRAELLRRELYLRVAQVGPYLGAADEETAFSVTTQRLALLGPDSAMDPALLIAARTLSFEPDCRPVAGRRWIDQLLNPAPDQPLPAQPLPELLARAQCYQYSRIDRQISWFQRHTTQNEKSEERTGKIIGWSLVAAIVAGVLHAFRLVAQPGWLDPYSATGIVLTLVLPPLAAMLIALRELYAFRARAASFRSIRAELEADKPELDRLVERMGAYGSDQESVPVAELRELSRDFQRLVLHLEAGLTIELQAWIMFTARDEYAVDL